MRRFNLTMILLVSLNILVLTIATIFLVGNYYKDDRSYLVEINRDYSDFSKIENDYYYKDLILDSNTLSTIDTDGIYVKQIYYYIGNDADIIESLYDGSYADNEYLVRVLDDAVIMFSYDNSPITSLIEEMIILGLYALISITMLICLGIYIKNKILLPFNQIQNLPYDLSKGNLSKDFTESKNRYFGKFIWGLSMLRDKLYSDRKKEHELMREKKMLIISVSHDIKTPLSAITLYAEALKQNSEDINKTKEFSVKILKNVAEIKNFVDEIVRMSKDEILNIEVSVGEFYLADLINKINYEFKEKLSIRQIDFQIADYDNVMLKGDFEKTFEVFGNLIENAIKYGDGRYIRIDFDIEDNHQLIKVSNGGDVIRDADMSHLFEAFFRAENAIGKEGSGLGLYISKTILRKMDGDIYAIKSDNEMTFVAVIKKS